jgi:transcriptional regulator with XRE-family HTH domain
MHRADRHWSSCPRADGDALRLAREAAGLTRVQLARQTGVNTYRITNLERSMGGARWRPAELQVMAQQLGVDTWELIDTPTAPSPIRVAWESLTPEQQAALHELEPGMKPEQQDALHALRDAFAALTPERRAELDALLR